jgi:diguanylate cyclase (GGDEF)-like protein
LKSPAGKILIAEGESHRAKVLERALLRSEPGLSIRSVCSGTDLVWALGQERLSCVVCAAELPDAALPELMTQIADALGRVPVVAISDRSDQQVAVACFRAGVSDFLSREDAIFGDALWGSVRRAMGALDSGASVEGGLERRQSELLNMAERDQLSGLYNRRYLERRLRSSAYQTDRRRRMGCVFLDIDRFKRINDQYGHAVGDRILQGVSQLISDQIGGGDAAIRWGGEEFVVLKASADLVGVWNWAQDLCNAASSMRFESCGREIQVTLSAGVVSFPTRQMSHERIDQADQAMLLAKRKGRNRVCTAQMVEMEKLVDQVRSLEIGDFDVRLARLLQLSQEILGPTQWRHVVEHGRAVEGICLWLSESMRLESGRRESLRRAALCHDLGKSFLPDGLLSQSGRLKPAQWRLVRRHAALGAELAEALGLCPMGVYLVRTHHDGPMRGKVAPLEAGILAVADALAAMKADRPYAQARSTAEALLELHRCSGEQFHPRVVQAVDAALSWPEVAA